MIVAGVFVAGIYYANKTTAVYTDKNGNKLDIILISESPKKSKRDLSAAPINTLKSHKIAKPRIFNELDRVKPLKIYFCFIRKMHDIKTKVITVSFARKKRLNKYLMFFCLARTTMYVLRPQSKNTTKRLAIEKK
jgi:hypothetical protein